MAKTPPLKVNIYPNLHDRSLWQRIKVAFRIIFYKQYFPAPLDWYEKLYPLVSDEYSECAERAVAKAERDCDKGPYTRLARHKEAAQWLRHYAVEKGKSGDIPDWKANFLVEWQVLRKKGVL